MQALKQFQPDHAIEFLPHPFHLRQVIAHRVQMRRVEAESHARPECVRQRVAQVTQLLERRAQRGPRPRGAFDPDLHVTGHRSQTFGVRARVALETGIPIVHVVPRMRHDRAQAQRARSVQLVREALHAARAQHGVGRGQIDQVAVVCDDRLQAMSTDLTPELLDRCRRERRFAPLVRCLGEELDRGGAQRTAACRRGRHATLARDVGPEHHNSSVNASREISGTNRTPPAPRCCTAPPFVGRSRMTSS